MYPFCRERLFTEGRAEIPRACLPVAETRVYHVNHRVVGSSPRLGNELGAIFVHPDHWGRGFGRLLPDDVVARGQALTLSVFTRNEVGRRFYEPYGWIDTGKRTTHEPTGEELVQVEWIPR